jgi:hypothetical protein
MASDTSSASFESLNHDALARGALEHGAEDYVCLAARIRTEADRNERPLSDERLSAIELEEKDKDLSAIRTTVTMGSDLR